MERDKIRTAKLPKNVSIASKKEAVDKDENKEVSPVLQTPSYPCYFEDLPKPMELPKLTINNIDQVDPHALVQAMVATFGLKRTKDCWEHYCVLKEMLEEIKDGDES